MLPNAQANIVRTLRTISFLDTNGCIKALIWNWACHPVGIPENDGAGSHYVGFVRNEVRKFLGKRVAVLFLPGFMGDIRPNFSTSRPRLNQRVKNPIANCYFTNPTAEIYNEFCRSISASTLAALNSSETQPLYLGNVRVKRESIHLSELLSETQYRSLPIASLWLNDEVSFLFVGAEVLNGYALSVKKDLAEGVIPVGYFEDVFGYLPLDHQLNEGGYEVNGFQERFGIRGKLRSGLQERFWNRVLVLYKI